MKLSLAVLAATLAPALATAQQADIPQHVPTDRGVTLGLSASGSRFGTAHQTLYQSNAIPFVSVELGRGVRLFGALPVAGGFARNSSCCRYSVGNVTAGVGYRRALTHDLALSVNSSASAPTSPSQGQGGRNGLYAASTELTRDAGLFLPDTTTLRLGLLAEYTTRRFAISARAAAHAWLGDDDATLVVPVAVHISWKATRAVHPVAGLRTVSRVLAGPELAAAVEAGLAIETRQASYRSIIAIPFDSASRALGIASLLGAVSWRI